MDRTVDFPACHNHALVVQWIEHRTSNSILWVKTNSRFHILGEENFLILNPNKFIERLVHFLQKINKLIFNKENICLWKLWDMALPPNK